MIAMKKLSVAIALAGAATGAQALELDLKLSQAELQRDNLDWYAPYAVGNADDVGAGSLHEISPSAELDTSFAISMDLGNNWTGTARFGSVSYSEKETKDVNFEATATRLHPNYDDVADGDWDLGMAEYELDQQSIDLELSYAVSFGSGKGSIEPLVGLRSLTIDQSFDTVYDTTTGTDGVNVFETVDTEAFGLYFGAQGTWMISDALGIEGRAEMGLLQASTERSNLEYQDDFDSIATNLTDTTSENVTTLATSIGVMFKATDSIKVRAGYELERVSGLSDFINFPDDVVDGTVARDDQNLGTSGLYIGASMAL